MPLISSFPPFMVHVDVDRFLTIESWLGVTMPLGLKEVATSLLTRVCVAAVKPQFVPKEIHLKFGLRASWWGKLTKFAAMVAVFSYPIAHLSEPQNNKTITVSIPLEQKVGGQRDVADSCRIGVATNVIFGLALGWKLVIICSFCTSADTTEGRMKDTESSTLHVVMKVGEIRSLSLPHKVNRMALLISLCKVFTLRSVPLETYLPDGDIDLSAFSNNPSLKDTWAREVVY
ncbi:hypothetical protein Tco_0060458 [Tanacetum coccineum]